MGTATEVLKERPLTERPAWKALEANYKKVRKLHLRQLFADERDRGERLTAAAAGVYLDYSKNRITDENAQASLPTRDGIGVEGQN